jgi:hypothetical protein
VNAWRYLRFDDSGRPAAGSFPRWPDFVAQVTVRDPCCGSGHFLVIAFEMLLRMRMEAEGVSAAEAGDGVLRANLFGLELDPRCTQIAAFALALQAWKTGGYRELPIPNIACSGISAKVGSKTGSCSPAATSDLNIRSSASMPSSARLVISGASSIPGRKRMAICFRLSLSKCAHCSRRH